MDTPIDTETLALLRESIERYGREQYGFEARQARLRGGDGFGRDAWSDYASMGWLALPMAEADGGFASAPAAIGALMHHVGAQLALEPLFASVVLCGRLFGLAPRSEAAGRCLQSLASGGRIFAFAHAERSDRADGPMQACSREGRVSGRKLVVLHGDVADAFIVSARDGDGTALFLVDGRDPGVRRTAYRLIDGRGAAAIEFDDAAASCLAGGDEAEQMLALALDDARLALCAEAHGAVKALNRLTLGHLKDRRQFGRPIGSNQALQHRMVELYILEEELRAVIGAAWKLRPDAGAVRGRAIAGALAHAMTVGRHVSHEAVQLHGGMGITDESPVSHYFRRLMVVNRLLGHRDAHLDRFAAGV